MCLVVEWLSTVLLARHACGSRYPPSAMLPAPSAVAWPHGPFCVCRHCCRARHLAVCGDVVKCVSGDAQDSTDFRLSDGVRPIAIPLHTLVQRYCRHLGRSDMRCVWFGLCQLLKYSSRTQFFIYAITLYRKGKRLRSTCTVQYGASRTTPNTAIDCGYQPRLVGDEGVWDTDSAQLGHDT